MTGLVLTAREAKPAKRRLSLLAAGVVLVSAWGSNSFAAGAFDTKDPDYLARGKALVEQGKISDACLPSSATAPDKAYTAIPEPSAELIAAAVKEGQVVLNSGISDKASINAFQGAFELRYPGVKLVVASGSSASLEERFLADHAAGNQEVDAVITNKIQWATEALKEKAILPLDQTIPGFFSSWPSGSWKWETEYGALAPALYRALGFAYNSDLVKGDLVPTKWEDLANPAFKGQLLAVDPAASATYARVWKHIMDTVGDDTMKKIGDNMIKQPLYTDIQPAAQVLGAGGGMVIMEMGLNVAASMKASGAPVQAVVPDTATGPQYVLGVAADAPHPNAVKLFTHWLYSAEGQWVTSCSAVAGTVAYPAGGAKTFVQIDSVSKSDMAKIKELLGI
ncbi:extracellular solute-binding protein [Aminobacter sp. AP02]|uniref:ABC transporter substrate-binding protein n=1 Tax=Aminobacter sp. AP02 TaxID=2135737 RepID=UPI000D7B6CB4|nr:extracellular solute-binding protein [Aminobacter sp. AP02]PWK60332.1 ABC-type Fe3+ transport system substrate-binding protein [Aminobacter sp. AP02]